MLLLIKSLVASIAQFTDAVHRYIDTHSATKITMANLSVKAEILTAAIQWRHITENMINTAIFSPMAVTTALLNLKKLTRALINGTPWRK